MLPSLHNLHEELLEHKPKQTDSEWNVFARQRITAIPRLLPQLAAYTRQTLSPVPFVVTWSADLIEGLLTTTDRDNRVEELTIVFDPEFRRHITQTLSDNVEDNQDRWLTAIDSFVLTHRHLDDSYPAFHLTVADYLDDKGDADSAQLVMNGPSFMIGHDPETGAYQLRTTTLWSKTKTDDINALQLNHVPIGEPTPDWRQLEHLYELLIEWPSGTLPDPDPDTHRFIGDPTIKAATTAMAPVSIIPKGTASSATPFPAIATFHTRFPATSGTRALFQLSTGSPPTATTSKTHNPHSFLTSIRPPNHPLPTNDSST